MKHRFPLFKMMRGVTRVFMFNQIEITFFSYILTENQWQYPIPDIIEIAKDSKNVIDVLDSMYAPEDITLDLSDEYAQIVLYLCLNAYAVKFYFNVKKDMDIIDSYLIEFYPRFLNYFQKWNKSYATNSLKIKPKKLNDIFKKLGSGTGCMNKNIQEDYNNLVDNIIQISPPYNNATAASSMNAMDRNSQISSRH